MSWLLEDELSWEVLEHAAAAYGPGSWGFGLGEAATVKTAVPSDAVLDEAVRDEVKGWSRERQLEVYKWLNLEVGVRMGASLDHELTELRRKRREACKA